VLLALSVEGWDTNLLMTEVGGGVEESKNCPVVGSLVEGAAIQAGHMLFNLCYHII